MDKPRPRGKHLVRDLKRVFAEESSSVLVPAAFLAFAVLDAIPTPADVGYFRTQQWLSEHKNELTKQQYWAYQYFNYYGWDVFWYLTLFVLTYYGGVTLGQRLKVGLALVSAGAIFALLSSSGQNEEERPLREIEGPDGDESPFDAWCVVTENLKPHETWRR